MNERIQKLAEQAGFSFKYKTAPDELNPGHKLQDLEKFAELIVKECAKVARNTDLEDVDGGDSAVLYAASEAIENHFKV